MNIFIRSCRDPRKKANDPRLKTIDIHEQLIKMTAATHLLPPCAFLELSEQGRCVVCHGVHLGPL